MRHWQRLKEIKVHKHTRQKSYWNRLQSFYGEAHSVVYYFDKKGTLWYTFDWKKLRYPSFTCFHNLVRVINKSPKEVFNSSSVISTDLVPNKLNDRVLNWIFRNILIEGPFKITNWQIFQAFHIPRLVESLSLCNTVALFRFCSATPEQLLAFWLNFLRF